LRNQDSGTLSRAAASSGMKTGLLPAYVMTAEFDPLRDEGLAYGTRLMASDVAVEVHNFPGTFHGFDAAAPGAAVSSRALDEQCAVLVHHLLAD
jgi:acetyl esterase